MKRCEQLEVLELASSVDQRALRWFGHVERMNEYHSYKGLDNRSKWSAGTGYTDVRLDGQ